VKWADVVDGCYTTARAWDMQPSEFWALSPYDFWLEFDVRMESQQSSAGGPTYKDFERVRELHRKKKEARQ